MSYGVFGNIAEIIAYMTSRYEHVVLLGDFNINQLNVDSPAYNFLQTSIIEPFSLKQMVTEPTRITKDSCTLIDLVLASSPENIKFTGVVDIPGISDHCLVYISYALKRPKFIPKIIKRRDFRHFSELEFNRDMEQAQWGNIYAVDENDVDSQVTIIENIFLDNINKNAPFREIKLKKPIIATWMNDEIISLMDKRDKYKNKYNIYKDPLMFDTYKMLKNQVNHMIRKAKKADLNETINSKLNDIKKFTMPLK